MSEDNKATVLEDARGEYIYIPCKRSYKIKDGTIKHCLTRQKRYINEYKAYTADLYKRKRTIIAEIRKNCLNKSPENLEKILAYVKQF